MRGIYSPLPPGSYIRLLNVEVQTRWPRNEQVAAFKPVDLDEEPSAEYMAVSYSWGDSKEVARLRLIDGGYLSLSQTLVDLLTSLKKESSSFTLWIDALCINQADPVEKAAQVAQMGRVYESASKVLLWLGASTPESRTAFRLMEPQDDIADDSLAMAGMDAFFMLLARPWFRRVWVIQEVVIASDVVVACGDDRADFSTFSERIFDLWRTLDFDDAHPASAGLLCATRLLFIREAYQKDGRVSYETLLEAAFHCEATDRRDMVFALRGIADNTRPVPVPDYTVSEDRLFIDTARALLCHGESLDLLALCGIENQQGSPGFPTWAPDLRYTSFNEPFVPCERAGWNAGGPLQRSPIIESLGPAVSSPTLRLLIKPVAVVTQTCPPFNSNDVAEQQEAVQAVLDVRPEHVSQEEWTRGLISTLIWGLNIDDLDDLGGYEDDYREWMDWLAASSCQDDLANIARNRYHLTVKARISDWKAFMTSADELGVGPVAVAEGDVVCAVPGCRLPLVLRPDRPLSAEDLRSLSKRMWALVGWCFAEGMMFGEAKDVDHPFAEVQLL